MPAWAGPSLMLVRMSSEVRDSGDTKLNAFLGKRTEPLFTTFYHAPSIWIIFYTAEDSKIASMYFLLLPISTVSRLSATAQKLNSGAPWGAVLPRCTHTVLTCCPHSPLQAAGLFVSELPQLSDAPGDAF